MLRNSLYRFPKIYNKIRPFSQSHTALKSVDENQSNTSNDEQPKRQFKLRLSREPIYSFRTPFRIVSNIINGYVVRWTLDKEFNSKTFLFGAMQAVQTVSALISRGDFTKVADLMHPESKEIVSEIQHYFKFWNDEQRAMIEVKMKDLLLQPFIHNLTIMHDPNTGRMWVGVVVAAHGTSGLSQIGSDSLPEPKDNVDAFKQGASLGLYNTYTCNYRFVREYTKGIDAEWEIASLNHIFPNQYFSPDP